MADTECTVEVRLVCLGRRCQGGKLYVRFAEEGTDYAQARLFPLNKSTRRYQVGGIYRVEMNEDRSVASFSPTPWKDMDGRVSQEETAALRIASEAAEAEQRLFKGSKKIGDTEEVLGVLEPLRRIYRASDRDTESETNNLRPRAMKRQPQPVLPIAA